MTWSFIKMNDKLSEHSVYGFDESYNGAHTSKTALWPSQWVLYLIYQWAKTPMRCSNDTGVLTGTSKIHNRILLFTHLLSLALISSTVSQANLASLDCGPNFLEASTAALMAFWVLTWRHVLAALLERTLLLFAREIEFGLKADTLERVRALERYKYFIVSR